VLQVEPVVLDLFQLLKALVKGMAAAAVVEHLVATLEERADLAAAAKVEIAVQQAVAVLMG
jgi:hypothetical protein